MRIWAFSERERIFAMGTDREKKAADDRRRRRRHSRRNGRRTDARTAVSSKKKKKQKRAAFDIISGTILIVAVCVFVFSLYQLVMMLIPAERSMRKFRIWQFRRTVTVPGSL